MKMVSIDVTVLVDDDVSAESVRQSVSNAIGADMTQNGYEWYEVATTSERPYAEES